LSTPPPEPGQSADLGPALCAAPPEPPEPPTAPGHYDRRTRLPNSTARPLSPAIARAWSRAADVDEYEVLRHTPSSYDLAIAEGLVAGHISVQAISDHSGKDYDGIRRTLQDPVSAAWISKQVSRQVQHRLGLVDAALFRAAVSGHIAAIKLFYERFDKLAPTRTEQHNTYNFGSLATPDLQRLVAARLRSVQGRDDRAPLPPGRATGAEPSRPVPLLSAPCEGPALPQPPPHEAPVRDSGSEQIR
jgi:hypothetical protein